MKFPTIQAAQDWSTSHDHHIYVEIEGADGVLEVYPGGRKVFVCADKGKIYQRWIKRLTPDSEFYGRLGKSIDWGSIHEGIIQERIHQASD